MASGLGWSVAGQRIAIKPGLGGGKLLVDGAEKVPLKSKGEFPFDLGGKRFVLKREAGLLGVKDSLADDKGRRVPQTTEHVRSTPAAAGERCAQHADEDALVTCPRCGDFACEQCCAADLTHCGGCGEQLLDKEKARAAALAFMAPVLVFAVAGGLIGGLVGGAAGAIAVAIAQRTDSRFIRWASAIGLYTVAAIAYVVLAGLLHASMN